MMIFSPTLILFFTVCLLPLARLGHGTSLGGTNHVHLLCPYAFQVIIFHVSTYRNTLTRLTCFHQALVQLSPPTRHFTTSPRYPIHSHGIQRTDPAGFPMSLNGPADKNISRLYSNSTNLVSNRRLHTSVPVSIRTVPFP